MSSISIDLIKDKPKDEIYRQLVKDTGCYRIYKYANIHSDKPKHKTDHTHYKLIGSKAVEEEFFQSPNVHNPIMVYDLIEELNCLCQPGDLVKHKERVDLVFEVTAIFPSADFKKGDCLYECRLPDGSTFNYHQDDLTKATVADLK